MASSEESRVAQCLPLSKVSGVVVAETLSPRSAAGRRQRNRTEFLSMPNVNHPFTIRESGRHATVYLSTPARNLQHPFKTNAFWDGSYVVQKTLLKFK